MREEEEEAKKWWDLKRVGEEIKEEHEKKMQDREGIKKWMKITEVISQEEKANVILKLIYLKKKGQTKQKAEQNETKKQSD